MRLHLLTLLVLLPICLTAQNVKWEGGLLVGGAGYQGDLVSGTMPDLKELGSEFSLLFRRKLGTSLGLRFQAAYITYRGEDDYPRRNFAFEATMAQLSAQVEWAPWDRHRYPAPYQFNPIVSPYLFVGVGGAYVDATPDFPPTEDEGLLLKIKDDMGSASAQFLPLIPLGIGAKVDLSPRYAVMAEAGTQTAFSDHLDAISQSANPGANDWLAFARVGLVVRFLPKDSDKDGIADEDDACPDIEGAWSAAGCPDADEDGVEDLEDLCPDIPGTAALNGCADSDGDGVADSADRCPYDKGAKSALGCPDWDQDGIADIDDRCPRLKGKKAMLGCPPLDADADGQIEDEAPICLPSFFAKQLEHYHQKLVVPAATVRELLLIWPEKAEVQPVSDFDF